MILNGLPVPLRQFLSAERLTILAGGHAGLLDDFVEALKRGDFAVRQNHIRMLLRIESGPSARLVRIIRLAENLHIFRVIFALANQVPLLRISSPSLVALDSCRGAHALLLRFRCAGGPHVRCRDLPPTLVKPPGCSVWTGHELGESAVHLPVRPGEFHALRLGSVARELHEAPHSRAERLPLRSGGWGASSGGRGGGRREPCHRGCIGRCSPGRYRRLCGRLRGAAEVHQAAIIILRRTRRWRWLEPGCEIRPRLAPRVGGMLVQSLQVRHDRGKGVFARCIRPQGLQLALHVLLVLRDDAGNAVLRL